MSAEADPPPLTEPVEALKHIRGLDDGSCETIYGTRAEPIIQMIRGVLDKALPPTPERRQKKR